MHIEKVPPQYKTVHGADWSSKGWSSQYTTDNKFQETVTYADFRGNIKTINRKGWTAGVNMPTSGTLLLTGIFNTIDQLSYTYDPSNSNKLILRGY